MFSHGCVHQASTCDNCKLNELSMKLNLNLALQKQVNQNNNKKFDSIEKRLCMLLDMIHNTHALITKEMCESLSESLEKNSNENTTESLCSAAFNNDKKKGLSFEEAIKLLREGKSIRRLNRANKEYCYLDEHEVPRFCYPGVYDKADITFDDIINNDWIVY